jgi:hypothetical protein
MLLLINYHVDAYAIHTPAPVNISIPIEFLRLNSYSQKHPQRFYAFGSIQKKSNDKTNLFLKKKCEDVLELGTNQKPKQMAEDETKMKGARRVSSLQRNDINFSL